MVRSMSLGLLQSSILLGWLLPAGVASGEPQAAAPAPAVCQPQSWTAKSTPLPPLLGKPKLRRGTEMIVGFSLDTVAPSPTTIGVGGISGPGDPRLAPLAGCGLVLREPAQVGVQVLDEPQRLRIEITEVQPLPPRSDRLQGVRCSYRITDTQDASRFIELPDQVIPRFCQLTGIIRQQDEIYLTLQYNGYASESNRQGNLVLAADLCHHSIVWTTTPLTSNAPLLLLNDYLITGYGFTAEPDFLYVLNRFTGQQIQKFPLPTAPEELRLQDRTLFVRIYDGYATFPLLKPKPTLPPQP